MSDTRSLFRSVVPALLAGAALSAATSTHAAPPEVTRYCRTHVHPAASYSYHMDGGKTPTVCIDPKSGAVAPDKKMRTPVDMAVACRLTSGSDDFRYVDGYKIDCSPNKRPEVREGQEGVHLLLPEDLTKYCRDWYGPGATGGYSAALKRAVCSGGSAASPQTINFMLLCDLYYKTDKVRYVDAGDEYYVACLR